MCNYNFIAIWSYNRAEKASEELHVSEQIDRHMIMKSNNKNYAEGTVQRDIRKMVETNKIDNFLYLLQMCANIVLSFHLSSI